MQLFVVSYLAGVLTVAAPCILPILPVIVGGSILESKQKNKWSRPLLITGSLAISIVLFTFLLKATTSLIGVPQYVWSVVSGSIVLILGIFTLFPNLWDHISQKTGLKTNSSLLMQKSAEKKSFIAKDILMGLSLGPVFSSCSPTYALIVAIVLPESLFKGTTYLLSYVFGIVSILLVISVAGGSMVKKLGLLSNPSGWLRKVIGISFIIVGLAVATGLDKDLQSYILQKGWYAPIEQIEMKLR